MLAYTLYCLRSVGKKATIVGKDRRNNNGQSKCNSKRLDSSQSFDGSHGSREPRILGEQKPRKSKSQNNHIHHLSTMAEVARPQKRPRSNEAEATKPGGKSGPEIPSFETKRFDPKAVAEAFDTFQCTFLPNVELKRQNEDEVLTWKDLGGVYKRLNLEDKESWCIETTTGSVQKPKWEDFLKPEITTNDVAYCSFLIQKDKESFSATQEKLPVKDFSPWNDWNYEPCLWIFFGRNGDETQTTELQGRPEHTDSISHDGTWHYQLSGSKRWLIRPTTKLLEHMEERLNPDEFSAWEESSRIQIDCHKGDVIIINTRLWYHQTIIPPQKEPSVSYARDFWVKKKETTGVCMTNVDGLYATNDIEPGTIIFRENEMPDGELHRSSTNPNCEVVELEDGTGAAVVSSRKILEGDFFCIPESSDEGEEECDDEDTGSFEEIESE